MNESSSSIANVYRKNSPYEIIMTLISRCTAIRLGRLLVLFVLGLTTYSHAFRLAPPTRTRSVTLLPATLKEQSTVELRTYEYQDWTVQYRYKPAAPGHERDPPLLLMHPVGIGLSSWFWERFLNEWSYGGPVYAPDLLGCGTQTWNASDASSSFPEQWVQACEAVLALLSSSYSRPLRLPWQQKGGDSSSRWIVVTQGGLAPIGVRMAYRNPSQISHLVLTSPPTWSDMTTTVPAKELQRNDQFLRSPVWGSLAFAVLETRWAVSFFSNLFLFANDSIENRDMTKWLDRVQAGVGKGQRYPVMAFNAGFCQQVSYERELTELRQSTLILQGQDDTSRNREEYVQNMRNCRIQTIPGKNVLPWESPGSVCRAIREFV